jgi:preprotein translocase subunit SecG
MTIFLIIIHVIACIALIGIVLIQRGRGGGLVESFSSVESMFGPKTSSFLTKATTIFSTLFFITCLSLAVLSVRQSRSLMRGVSQEPAVKVALPVSKQDTQAAKPKPEATQDAAVQDLPKSDTVPGQQNSKNEAAPKVASNKNN